MKLEDDILTEIRENVKLLFNDIAKMERVMGLDGDNGFIAM